MASMIIKNVNVFICDPVASGGELWVKVPANYPLNTYQMLAHYIYQCTDIINLNFYFIAAL